MTTTSPELDLYHPPPHVPEKPIPSTERLPIGEQVDGRLTSDEQVITGTHSPSEERVPSEQLTSYQRVAVIGLGYVGLPLALHFARSGVTVLGLDIDPAKIQVLTQGGSYISHIHSPTLRKQLAAGRLIPSLDFQRISEVDAIIICVPTPLNKNREPDLSSIITTGQAIAPHLRQGMLVVLESTTYPGTTDHELRSVLETGSGLIAGKDFYLAFSPEREDPGNPDSIVGSIPKVVGGYTPACLQRATRLYQQVINTVIPVSSSRAAEATKLLENIFRSVNIALVNELKLIYGAMDIDIWEVIAAASTKPFGYMPFYPGPGLGGHCIPIDPFYLTWKAREFGQHTRFIELAGEINRSMPLYVVQRVSEALNAQSKAINGSRLLLLGVAYKPNVDDDRESPTYHIMDLLSARGASLSYYDPHVPVIRPSRQHSHWAGTASITWSKEIISNFDAAIICTAHQLDYRQLADWIHCVIDTRNVMDGLHGRHARIWKA